MIKLIKKDSKSGSYCEHKLSSYHLKFRKGKNWKKQPSIWKIHGHYIGITGTQLGEGRGEGEVSPALS